MVPPAPSTGNASELPDTHASDPSRSQSFSQKSDASHTAAEFIDNQLQLEADAREALPYKFDHCTKLLGNLRQNLFSCLTCNPPPTNPTDAYNPAGVCYSCSIQCHGEHTLVELFNKRNFECDCGTTRLPPTAPCTLRVNPTNNETGGAHSEQPSLLNNYNQNFKNRFCGCDCDYDADKQKGTMFQCLGLGTAETGGCGEDWWHPGCLVGLGPEWYENMSSKGLPTELKNEGFLESIAEVAEAVVEDKAETNEAPTTNIPKETLPTEVEDDDEDPPMPPGFPNEDDFEGFICYKCVDANPWIKRYADAPGFLAPVFKRSTAPSPETGLLATAQEIVSDVVGGNKRKAEDDLDSHEAGPIKRLKEEVQEIGVAVKEAFMPEMESSAEPTCKYKVLPSPPEDQFSLFFKSDFRDHLCRCSDCFPNLKPHSQLLEEEIIYEPSLSGGSDDAGGSTVGSGSIYERGESALKNVDRVRAIEGVMAFNHLKDKLMPFFQQFAESGEAISAEDIKAHFAKMRGDADAIKAADDGAAKGGEGEKKDDGDNRREQGGF